jgi:hypothetical protein
VKFYTKLFLPLCLICLGAPVSAQQTQSQMPSAADPYYARYAQVVYPQTGQPAQNFSQYYAPGAQSASPAPAAANYGAAWTRRTPEAIATPDAVATPDQVEGALAPGSYDEHLGGYAEGCADGSCGDRGWRRHFKMNGWYGSMAGLAMTRDLPNRYVLATDAVNLDQILLTNRDAAVDWEAGYAISIGRCLNCNTRVDFGYWGLNEFQGFSDVAGGVNNLVTPYDMQGVQFNGGAALLSDFFDNSNGHEIFRTNDFQNFEINIYHRPCAIAPIGYAGGASGCDSGCGGCGSCCRWNVELLAGVRYFNFDERLIWAGVEDPFNFGDNGGANEALITSDVENHLIGLQIGALVDYYFTKRISGFALAKVGVYGNHSNVDFDIRTGDNVPGQSAFSGEFFPVSATKDDVALLAELELGARWDINCHWSAFASYRAVAVSGVALSDEQIPFTPVDMTDIRSIDTNGDLILHGATFGVQFAY